LARLIDVGLDATKCSGKEVLLLLSTPSEFYESRSRLYWYKVNEYSDPSNIKRDITWRTLQEIEDNLLEVQWIALEKLIGSLYKDFTHPDKEQALDFFRERNLA
jgi:hypothetical protein